VVTNTDTLILTLVENAKGMVVLEEDQMEIPHHNTPTITTEEVELVEMELPPLLHLMESEIITLVVEMLIETLTPPLMEVVVV